MRELQRNSLGKKSKDDGDLSDAAISNLLSRLKLQKCRVTPLAGISSAQDKVTAATSPDDPSYGVCQDADSPTRLRCARRFHLFWLRLDTAVNIVDTVHLMKIERLDTLISFRTSKSELSRVVKIARFEDRSISQVIRRIFRRGLALEKAKS